MAPWTPAGCRCGHRGGDRRGGQDMMVALVVLAEVSLALLIILGLVAWKALQRRARDRAAVNTLVTSINTQRSSRTQKLTERLKNNNQNNNDDALTKANELIKKQGRGY